MYNAMLRTLAKCCKNFGLNSWATWLTSSLAQVFVTATFSTEKAGRYSASASATITVPAGSPKSFSPRANSPQANAYSTAGSFGSYQNSRPRSPVGFAPQYDN